MLLSLLLLPIIGSVLIFLLRGSYTKYLALLVSVIQFLLTVCVLTRFNISDSIDRNLVYELKYQWTNAIKSSIHFGIDGMSLLMLFLTNLLIPIVILSSFHKKNTYQNTFYALVLMMQFGLVGVFTALDGLMFYAFWEITLIPIWFICGIWGDENKKIKITTKFFVYTFFGSLFMLVGLIFLYTHADSFDLIDLYHANLSSEQEVLVFWLIFIAFAVKLPLFPFNTWQPDTYTYAPSQGSMLLSGIMLKMAIYGVLRYLLPITPDAILGVSGKIVLVMAVCGIIYGAFAAIVSKDIKRIIAYSSLSHVGLMVGGIFATAFLTLDGHFTIEGGIGALVQAFAHGINVVGLFYCADILIRKFGTRNIDEMGGFAKVAPVFSVLFMLILFGSMAVPLTNGFVGEFILLKSIFDYNILVFVISGLTVIFAAVYFLRLYGRVMFGQGSEEKLKILKDVSYTEFIGLFVICFLVLSLGIFPNFVIDLVRNSLRFVYLSVIS